MRGGWMFFLNLGNITRAARFCLLPIIFLLIFGAKGFMLIIVMAIVLFGCVALSLIPAPSDKRIMSQVEQFRDDFEDRYSLKAASKSSVETRYIKGYEIKGRMLLKRHIHSRAVYPIPTLLAFKQDRISGDGALVLGRMYMLHGGNTVYTKSDVYNDSFSIKTYPYRSNSEVLIAEISAPEYPHGIKILFENNHMTRSYLEQIMKIAARSEG